MRGVAKAFNLPLCDLHDLFKADFKKHPRLVDAVIRSDGVHLTEEGNKMSARYLSPVILSALGKQRCLTNSSSSKTIGELPTSHPNRDEEACRFCVDCVLQNVLNCAKTYLKAQCQRL